MTIISEKCTFREIESRFQQPFDKLSISEDNHNGFSLFCPLLFNVVVVNLHFLKKVLVSIFRVNFCYHFK